jgi:hypothetical protein
MVGELMCRTIQDYPGTTGAMSLLYSVRDCVPIAFNALLFIIFFVLFAGNYFIIKNKTGRAKILIALLSSSFVMIVLSMLLALSNLVTFRTVLAYGFISIVTFIMFMLSDNS